MSVIPSYSQSWVRPDYKEIQEYSDHFLDILGNPSFLTFRPTLGPGPPNLAGM